MSRIQAAFNALGRELLESEKPAVAAFKAKYAGKAVTASVPDVPEKALSRPVSYTILKNVSWAPGQVYTVTINESIPRSAAEGSFGLRQAFLGVIGDGRVGRGKAPYKRRA